MAQPLDERDPTEAPWPAPMRIPVVWLLAIACGVAYGLHSRDTAMAPLAWFSTVPLLLVAVHPKLQGRGNAAAACLAFALLSFIGVEWLRGQAVVSWLVAPNLYWPLFVPAWAAVRLVRRRWPAFPLALLWPLAWTGVEWLRVRVSPGELALCVLGHSQIGLTKMVQVADLAGVAAVTFWVAAVNGLLADLLVAATTRGGLRAGARRLVPQVAGVLGLLVLVGVYGVARDTEKYFQPGPRLHVVQTNTPRTGFLRESHRIYDVQVMQTLSTLQPDTDAILWPENSLCTPLTTATGFEDSYFIIDLKVLATRLGQPILVDGWRASEAAGGNLHSSVFIEPGGALQVYDKVRLLPYTEVVPGRDALALLGDRVLGAWQAFITKFTGVAPTGVMGRFEDIRPMTLRGRDGREWRFGTPLCFEIATARVVNAWHRQGVDFLVNQTSEGKLGDAVHETTIAISGFRAIEGRVSVVRATNDGISALVDPNGRIREMLHGRYTGSPINEAGVFYPQVVIDTRRPTLYARMGDAFAIGCLLASLLLATAAWWQWRARTRAAAAAAAAAAPLAPVPDLPEDGGEPAPPGA